MWLRGWLRFTPTLCLVVWLARYRRCVCLYMCVLFLSTALTGWSLDLKYVDGRKRVKNTVLRRGSEFDGWSIARIQNLTSRPAFCGRLLHANTRQNPGILMSLMQERGGGAGIKPSRSWYIDWYLLFIVQTTLEITDPQDPPGFVKTENSENERERANPLRAACIVAIGK